MSKPNPTDKQQNDQGPDETVVPLTKDLSGNRRYWDRVNQTAQASNVEVVVSDSESKKEADGEPGGKRTVTLRIPLFKISLVVGGVVLAGMVLWLNGIFPFGKRNGAVPNNSSGGLGMEGIIAKHFNEGVDDPSAAQAGSSLKAPSLPAAKGPAVNPGIATGQAPPSAPPPGSFARPVPGPQATAQALPGQAAVIPASPAMRSSPAPISGNLGMGGIVRAARGTAAAPGESPQLPQYPTPAVPPAAATVTTEVPATPGFFWSYVLPLSPNVSLTSDALAEAFGVQLASTDAKVTVIVSAPEVQTRQIDVELRDRQGSLARFTINPTTRSLIIEAARSGDVAAAVTVNILNAGGERTAVLTLAPATVSWRVNTLAEARAALREAQRRARATAAGYPGYGSASPGPSAGRTTAVTSGRSAGGMGTKTGMGSVVASALRSSSPRTPAGPVSSRGDSAVQQGKLQNDLRDLEEAFQNAGKQCIQWANDDILAALSQKDQLVAQQQALVSLSRKEQEQADLAELKAADLADAAQQQKWHDEAEQARQALTRHNAQLSAVQGQIHSIDAKLLQIAPAEPPAVCKIVWP